MDYSFLSVETGKAFLISGSALVFTIGTEAG
jgi:hypothetical protein